MRRDAYLTTTMTPGTTQYWEDRHAAAESLDTVGWTGLGRSFNAWMYAVRKRVFKRVASAHVPVDADARVLDVGSGTGFYLDAWREIGASRIEGSDFSDTAVARLRAAYPDVPIHKLDIGAAETGIASASYDAVSAMDVLFHILDEEAYARAITNLAGLLRPRGHVVLSENLLARGVHRGPTQVCRTESQILALLAEAGLEPVAQAPMFVLMNTPIDSRSQWLARWFTLVSKVASRNEVFGWIAGALLMPIELIAVRLAGRGPSTKILVCRRLSGP